MQTINGFVQLGFTSFKYSCDVGCQTNAENNSLVPPSWPPYHCIVYRVSLENIGQVVSLIHVYLQFGEYNRLLKGLPKYREQGALAVTVLIVHYYSRLVVSDSQRVSDRENIQNSILDIGFWFGCGRILSCNVRKLCCHPLPLKLNQMDLQVSKPAARRETKLSILVSVTKSWSL